MNILFVSWFKKLKIAKKAYIYVIHTFGVFWTEEVQFFFHRALIFDSWFKKKIKEKDTKRYSNLWISVIFVDSKKGSILVSVVS